MNASIPETLMRPVPYYNSSKEAQELEEEASDMMYLAPIAGVFFTHNASQSLLLGRTVSYFKNPITNYFLNLPIGAIGGFTAYAFAKLILTQEQKETASTDLEAVNKSIGWSAVATTISAIGINELILKSNAVDAVTRGALAVAQGVLGTFTIEVGFVIASACLATALISLAEGMVKEEPEK